MNDGRDETKVRIDGMHKHVFYEWSLACIWLNKDKNNPNREYLKEMMRQKKGCCGNATDKRTRSSNGD